MTLENRFQELDQYDEYGIIYRHNESKCVSITDEQMIKFAEWFHANYENIGVNIYRKFGNWKIVTIIDALSEYKKQNGL